MTELHSRPEIHITDMMSFLQCRRRWDWSSPLRRGLQRASMPEPLFLGQGMHKALEVYYSVQVGMPIRLRDIDTALKAYTEWVRHRAEKIRRMTGPLWAEEKQMLADVHNLGRAMLLHYHLWSQRVDDVYVIESTERKFSTPILDEQGNDTGMDFAGRLDGILLDVRNQNRYVLEFKTTKQLGHTEWVYRSIQGTAYMMAARQEFQRMRGIVYRMLRKKAPSGPMRLQNGGFSQAQKQDTTNDWFRYCLAELSTKMAETRQGVSAIETMRQLFVENRRILEHLQSQPNKFFEQRVIHKDNRATDNVRLMLLHAGRMMIDPNVPIFAQPDWFVCSRCPFQDPCDLMEYGGDHESVLEAEYGPRTYWEGEDDDVRP